MCIHLFVKMCFILVNIWNCGCLVIRQMYDLLYENTTKAFSKWFYNTTSSVWDCQLLLILHVPRQAQFSLLSLCLDDLLLGSHSTTLISFKRKKNQMTNQMTLYLVVYMSVPPWTMSSGMAENTPLIWEPCFLSSIWLEQGFNNWLLSVCFTHWGHRERFEENSPPNSSTTQPWDFYKWFLLPCGCIFFFL